MLASIKAVLATALEMYTYLKNFDVQIVFCNGYLKEVIYMKQSFGFEGKNKADFCVN